MDTAERKRLIARGKENEKIAEAIAEERRILAKKPVHRMEPDPRLKHMKKADAVKLLNEKRERMATGVAIMAGKSEAPPKEAPKAEKLRKGRRSTKVK